MERFIFYLEIIDKLGETYRIKIIRKGETAVIDFNPQTKELEFTSEGEVTKFLRENEHQFRKILHTKRLDTFYVGFELTFCLRKQKDVAGFNNKDKLVVLDKRETELKSYARDNYKCPQIPKIYTDGSFLEEINNGAYALIIERGEENYDYYTQEVEIKNSSLIELMAAIKGVEILASQEKIRIVTDSQYVRKGLTEWVMNWKLNNWQTVNGERVKHVEYWQQFDELTNGKYIEFEWVKAHSEHFENELCDILARETAQRQ